MEDENLLGEFERTGKWIEEGLKNGKDEKRGGVLVHWCVDEFLYRILPSFLYPTFSTFYSFTKQ